ncbi:NACHT domain-containing protein [Streptomyces sp. NPDC001852]|uniref:NACHT domain-containing protein n=1 Tax=Streptomyces sp. NPDC001852 TaxID=3364619 RepID=UPI0036C3F93D
MVLGEPGAGKTMLLIRLLLGMLERRLPGGPVPVLFPLASWDPLQQDLYTWMAHELAQDHPALRTPAPALAPQAGTSTQARALLEQRLILPILDGLDELPHALATQALYAINQTLPSGQPLVVSSRTAEYRNALTTPIGTTLLLNGAAGIRLLPLDPTKAAAYLQRDAGSPDRKAAARWSRVGESPGTGTPLSEALNTPLGLFLARTIYNPRPDEQLPALPNPDELLDQTRFPTRQHIDTHLFTAFIPAAYRPHPDQPTPWNAQKAQHTLDFLAHHLQHNLGGTPNLAWWQLPRALPHGRALIVLAAGLIAGLAVGLLSGLGSEVGVTFGLVAGLLSAAATAVITSSARDRPSSGIRWSWRRKSWLTWGLPLWLVFGLLFGIVYGIVGRPRMALLLGLMGGLPFGLLGGLRSVHPDLEKAVGPGTVLAQDRRTFSVLTLAGGITAALTVVLVTALALPFGFGTDLGLVFEDAITYAIGLGLPVGLMLALARSVWMQFLLARITLAAAGRVPWRFMSFLADAHERRGVLRQAGAVYQFRHLAEHQP